MQKGWTFIECIRFDFWPTSRTKIDEACDCAADTGTVKDRVGKEHKQDKMSFYQT